MVDGRKIGQFAGVAVLAGALVSPVSLSAQQARGSFQPSYHLMQLSVERDQVSFEEFKA